MSEVKTVLYTGAFRFPDQDAAAFRVFSVAELFKSSGFNVTFAGWECHPDSIKHYVYNGYNCFPQDEFRNGTAHPVKRLFGFLFRGRKTALWIWKNRENFDAVVAYNPTVFLSFLLLLMGKFFPFKVILDSTEWYESSHLPGGSLGLAAFENCLRMRLLYKLFDNVICISSFLENHYAGKNSVQIPPLLPNLNSINLNRPHIRSGVNLIYAGEAGKKDRLAALVASLPKIQDETQTKIQLHVVGMTFAELSELVAGDLLNQNYFSSHVVCHGRISRKEVLQVYGLCHFSILFRDRKRYAFAGFPTKAMESLATGCPIITNAVGDLSELVANGVNAFILEESQLEQLLPALLSQALSDGRYESMSVAATKTAINYFSLDSYKNKFKVFVDTCFARNIKG